MLTNSTTGLPGRNAEIDELLDKNVALARPGKLCADIEDGFVLLNHGSRFRQPTRSVHFRAGNLRGLSLGNDKVQVES